MQRILVLFAVVIAALFGGCARDTGLTPIKATTQGELQRYLLSHKANLEQFRMRGPFTVVVHENFEVGLSATSHINTDLYLSSPVDKAPLVILLHGYGNSKADHSVQAMHLASWGIHCLVLTLPNTGPWFSNGKSVAKLVELISLHPEMIDPRIDVKHIVLAGHSFGGTSMAIALAEGAPAAGAILLDPAGIGATLPEYLRRINKPVMVLGADEHVSVARNRGNFYRYIQENIAEVSITDAIHEDAQYPTNLGQTTEELQITFVSAMTATALSLAYTGKLDYAWASFSDDFKNGKLFGGKKK